MKVRVAIAKTPADPSVQDLKALLRDQLSKIGVTDRLIKAGSRILIKPNIGVSTPPEAAETTDPRLVEALILLLREFSPREIIVGESSVIGTDTRKAFETSGITAVAERTGATLVDFKKERYRRRPVQDFLAVESIHVPELIDEVDVIINVPKLKTIGAVPVSLGLKNLKGFLLDREKKLFHTTGLVKCIVDLSRTIKPHVTIIDGIIACEMYEPKETNLVFAGTDTLAVDVVATAVIGLDPEQVDYLRLAGREGVGVGTIGDIEILGCTIDEARTVLVSAPNKVEAFHAMFPEVKLVDGEACTGCTNSLYRSLRLLRKNGRLDELKGMTIAIGKNIDPARVDRDTIYLGNCLKEFGDHPYYERGCPFTSMDVIAIVDRIKADRGA